MGGTDALVEQCPAGGRFHRQHGDATLDSRWQYFALEAELMVIDGIDWTLQGVEFSALVPKLDRATMGGGISVSGDANVLHHSLRLKSLSVHGITPRFSLIVPVAGQPPHYRLYLQESELVGMPELPCSIESAVQTGLEENPYYHHVVQLRQLSRLEVCILDASSKPGWLVYEQGCLARGQKAGDIKPTALDSWTGWPDEFSRVVPSANLEKSNLRCV